MMVSVNNATQATSIFIAIFVVALLLSVRRRSLGDGFSIALTNELKGFAILAVVFSHVGYFLVNDTRFLTPLSDMAGVGVNIFLFLSGLGLAISSLKKDLSVWQFYMRRVLKLFIPLWIVLTIFFILDALVLHITYSWVYVIQSFVGLCLHADLYQDINSPLWYLTPMLMYYLIFPIIFSKKYPWASALLLYIAGYLFIYFQPSLFDNVLHLYKVHIIAFPLGVFAGSMIFSPNAARNYLVDKFKAVSQIFIRSRVAEFLLMVVLLLALLYTLRNSGIGEAPEVEQMMSIFSTILFIAIFLMKRININLLQIFGVYSYEIYLFHWPLMYRYDLIFKYVTPWLALIIYLLIFLGLGWLLSKASKLSFKMPKAKPST